MLFLTKLTALSHLKERVQQDCLNCNARVAGKFCQICGQENVEVVETTWQLVTHFFNDITHFDGKFFNTLRYLVFKPGFISSEYMKGRRASYLNPIRMYVFTSAIFFLIFFSMFHVDEKTINVSSKFSKSKLSDVELMDSASFAEFTSEINKGKPLSRQAFKERMDNDTLAKGFHFTSSKYKSTAEYDSMLAKGIKKHNWLERTLIHREIELNKKYNNDYKKILAAFVTSLQHSFPQMLFVSLPLFALSLQLFYFRRKKYYYTNHLIFSIHLYIFVFIILLVIMGLSQLHSYLHWDVFYWIIGLLYLYIFYYQYKSMRNFYQQGRLKTLLKFFLLNNMLFILIGILFTLFTFFSFLQI